MGVEVLNVAQLAGPMARVPRRTAVTVIVEQADGRVTRAAAVAVEVSDPGRDRVPFVFLRVRELDEDLVPLRPAPAPEDLS